MHTYKYIPPNLDNPNQNGISAVLGEVWNFGGGHQGRCISLSLVLEFVAVRTY